MNGTDPTRAQTTLVKLHSKDHEEILNVIDQLRSEGISRYLDLPQLIVCGDQSSGKSSVLEALSGLDFPRKDNLCTRFATELILRRTSQETVIVSIYPDDDRSPAEKERLRAFNPGSFALEQFADIIQRAGDFIGVGKDGQMFSKDVLRIELQGPEQPHLTLVDLPGLYHAPDESQTEEGIAFVESLVMSYMHNTRSVILAVISAKSDVTLQKVTSLTRKVDLEGTRTIGIITKPDTLEKGSDMEQSFYKLALNRGVRFDLGWHVLKNRNYLERSNSLDERCTSEKKFLSNGIWAKLPRNQVGIDALRPRLSAVLKDHILSELPGLIEESQITLKESLERLQRLGEARQTLADQRLYLFQTSERFNHLLTSAVIGNYHDAYFGDALTDEGYEKRLRAVVQNRLSDFSEEMRTRGQSRQIVDDDDEEEDEDEDEDEAVEKQIKRSAFIEEVRQRMRRTRGRELPGTFNPLIVGDLFYLHSKSWSDITTSYIDTLLSDLQKAVLPILQDIVDDKSSDGLLRHILNHKFDELETSLRSKAAELLEPQRAGHPITYNHYYVDVVQKAREEHRQKHLKQKLREFFPKPRVTAFSSDETHVFNFEVLVASLARETESDMEKFACSEAIDCMLAYYKVARKKFVDDFSNLAVEKCLLAPLSTIFTSQTVNKLGDDVIEDIAAEDESSRQERHRLEHKIAVLQTTLRRLHSLDRHHLATGTKTKTPALAERGRSISPDENSSRGGMERTEGSPQFVEEEEEEEEAYPIKKTVKDVPEEDMEIPIKKYKKKKHPSAGIWE